MSELIAIAEGVEMGIVRQERGRISFTYADSWRAAEGAYPLSLSMPLMAAQHAHAAIEPFLWGLLPDNDLILNRWAQKFQVSARNPFALLSHVGEDCAGAVQFAKPERVALLQAKDFAVDWLTDADISERLRGVLQDVSAGRMPRDTGQFSLAGAQPKTALLYDGARWGVPSGRAPTTHILKPSTPDFDGHAENEHICLSLARSLGLPAASSEVRKFEDVTAIIVTRYDRTPPPAFKRIHQEDMCQAIRVHPVRKYQNEGGPGPRQILDLLRANSSDQSDVMTFVDALIFNWIIAGTDAHAKNYSLLIGKHGTVRLAPLYDVASILAYPGIDPQSAKMAMKIGAAYRLRDIGWANWYAFAHETGIDRDELISRAQTMVHKLPDALEAQVATARRSGLSNRAIEKLRQGIGERAHLLKRT